MISTKGSMVLAGDPGPIKTRKQLTTSCLSLDLRRLAQKSRLIPSSRLTWVWKDVKGNVQGTVGIYLWADEIELIYGESARPRNELIREHIRLTSSMSHGGGRRQWFVCPGCGARVAILYLSETYFRCRGCERLAYPSQYPTRGWSYGRLHRFIEA